MPSFLHSKITKQRLEENVISTLILGYSVMTSNRLAETSTHIQYNPTTYAKGKYAYVFLIWVVIYSSCKDLYP